MFKILGDYHTHTTYSHGKGSIMENVIEARKAGLQEIAITDHGPEHLLFGVKRDDFKRMREEIDIMNHTNSGIKVLMGLECNIVSKSGIIDIDDNILGMLDFVIAGFHMMSKLRKPSDYLNLYCRHYSSQIIKSMKQGNVDINTRAVTEAIRNYPIGFISHPSARMAVDILEVAGVAAEFGTFLEINEKGNELSIEDIIASQKLGAKFIINSDAHVVKDIGKVEKSIALAEAAGLIEEDIMNVNKLPNFRR